MTNEYNVTKRDDGRLVVLLHSECKIDKDEILDLLQELGCDTSDITFLEPDQDAKYEDLKGTPVIIPIDEATCDLPALEDAGRDCSNAGSRVVVLFGPGYDYERLHPVADKYGTQCGWSAEKLRGCLSGEADAPSAASGKPATRADGRQVDC